MTTSTSPGERAGVERGRLENQRCGRIDLDIRKLERSDGRIGAERRFGHDGVGNRTSFEVHHRARADLLVARVEH
jgi:hypothetical protein